MADSADEEWRPVVGYEGLYSISSLGRVRRDTKGRQRAMYSLLTVYTRKDRYKQVCLTVGAHCAPRQRKYSVHRLVAEAHIGPIPLGHVVNHLNGDRSDNRVSNLEICTYKENSHHAIHSLGSIVRGENKPNSVLTEEQVLYARNCVAAGKTRRAVAKELGVGRKCVEYAVTGKSWQHVGGEHTSHHQMLTPSQREEVKHLAVAGVAPKLIAAQFGVTADAIRYHIRKMLRATYP